MQYSSGLISGRSILAPTGDVREQVYRYPRVLWNWLYENATRGGGHARKLAPQPTSAGAHAGRKVPLCPGKDFEGDRCLRENG